MKIKWPKWACSKCSLLLIFRLHRHLMTSAEQVKGSKIFCTFQRVDEHVGCMRLINRTIFYTIPWFTIIGCSGAVLVPPLEQWDEGLICRYSKYLFLSEDMVIRLCYEDFICSMLNHIHNVILFFWI